MSVMRDNQVFVNEAGSVLILALILLVVLTLLGISATTTTQIEVQVAGNEKLYKQNLYMAEAVAMEGLQAMEDTDLEVFPSWIMPVGSVDKDDIRNTDSTDPTNPWNNAQTSAGLGATTQYLAVYEGVASGSSLGMGGSRVHTFAVYGRQYDPNNPAQGRAIVRVGFRKAY